MATYVSDKRVPPQGLLKRVGTFETERFHPLVQKLYDDGRIDEDLYQFYLMAAGQTKSNSYDRDFGITALLMAVTVILSEMVLTVDDLMLIPAIGRGKAERMLHFSPREVEPEPAKEMVSDLTNAAFDHAAWVDWPESEETVATEVPEGVTR